MEMPVLEVSRDEAEAYLAHYEAQLADERTTEDDAIRAGYRAIARGLPLIQLPNVIAGGGFFESGLPHLAVARATAKTVWCYTDYGNLVFADRKDASNRGAKVGPHTVRVDIPCPRWTTRWSEVKTIVPVVPPQHRPKRTRLHRFHILWEVEAWTMVVPKDPALIQHVRGDLWAVHATWDLTALERAVLSARMTT